MLKKQVDHQEVWQCLQQPDCFYNKLANLNLAVWDFVKLAAQHMDMFLCMLAANKEKVMKEKNQQDWLLTAQFVNREKDLDKFIVSFSHDVVCCSSYASWATYQFQPWLIQLFGYGTCWDRNRFSLPLM